MRAKMVAKHCGSGNGGKDPWGCCFCPFTFSNLKTIVFFPCPWISLDKFTSNCSQFFFIPFREMSITEAEVSFDDYQKEFKLDVEWKWGEKYPMTIFLQGKPGENIEELGELREKLVKLNY
jgi:hypothetical protein